MGSEEWRLSYFIRLASQALIEGNVSAALELGAGLYEYFTVQKIYLPTIEHGHSFPPGTTEKATEVHVQNANERAQHVVEFAQRLLGKNYGRFASGKINHRKLARQFLAIVKPNYKERRVRQIIRAAVRSGELA